MKPQTTIAKRATPSIRAAAIIILILKSGATSGWRAMLSIVVAAIFEIPSAAPIVTIAIAIAMDIVLHEPVVSNISFYFPQYSLPILPQHPNISHQNYYAG